MDKIIFTENFRIKLAYNLIDNFHSFLNDCKKYLEENANNYKRASFEHLSSVQEPPFGIDFKKCKDFLQQAEDETNTITLGSKNGDGSKWNGNDILFPCSFRMPEITTGWGTPSFWAYREWQNNLEYACEKEFWAQADNSDGYDKCFKLNIFNDKTFAEDKLYYYQNNSRSYFSKEQWLGYITLLIETHFPEFVYNKKFSNKKTKRYLVEIKENLWFGLEYEEAEVVYQINKGVPSFPQYFNFVLLNSDCNKEEHLFNYGYREHQNIMSLGIVGNPFFYHPCYPVIGFDAIDRNRQTKLGNPYLSQIISLGNGTFQQIHSQEYGTSIKKHAFFYMSLLASSSNIYIDYLKRSILNNV